MSPRTIQEINLLPHDEFTRVFGPVFEHSPWIAEKSWHQRPFASAMQLHHIMREIVEGASPDRQLDLICAHPDLVGRMALAGKLTKESTGEQAAAGLNQLTPAEVELFQANNQEYKVRFNFPFIICARLNKKEAILTGFERRLKNSREQELKTALEEIFKIAELRLRDLIAY